MRLEFALAAPGQPTAEPPSCSPILCGASVFFEERSRTRVDLRASVGSATRPRPSAAHVDERKGASMRTEVAGAACQVLLGGGHLIFLRRIAEVPRQLDVPRSHPYRRRRSPAVEGKAALRLDTRTWFAPASRVSPASRPCDHV